MFNILLQTLNISYFYTVIKVMAKKKNITENDIISWYMDYVLNHNKQPSSVYSFAKENNFEEALFYNYFGSFDAIEKGVFNAFFNNTITLLKKSEDYCRI